MAEPRKVEVELDVEMFPKSNPSMDTTLLKHAREALGSHEASPRSMTARRGENAQSAVVAFANADPATARTFAREVIVENGAIVLAGLLLAAWEGKQITRVVPRGARVDYFVGERPEDFRWILEVSGTDRGDHATRRNQKRVQLLDSIYRRPPHSKNGFVAVTRFAVPACSSLDAIPVQDL